MQRKLVSRETVTGKRLILMIAEVDGSLNDAEAILAAMEPGTGTNLQMLEDGIPALDRQHAYILERSQSPSDFFFVIREHDGEQIGRLIGTIGLFEYDAHHHTARFGVMIFRKVDHGKGYASEAINLLLDFAFKDLMVNRVYGAVFLENSRSLSTYTRLGFKVEGIAREAYFQGGRFHDMEVIAMLRKDWNRYREEHEVHHE